MFTTTDPNDWQLIHMLETDTCKFAATLLHRLGSPRTIVFLESPVLTLITHYSAMGYDSLLKLIKLRPARMT